MASPTALALRPCLPTELLSYVLQQTYPTSLIICSTRAAFLSSLDKATLLPPPLRSSEHDIVQESEQPAKHVEDPSAEEEEEEVSNNPREHRHPLLVPTLHQISTSRHTTTAFIPTVSHLRAYLSTFASTALPKSCPLSANAQTLDRQGNPVPLVVVYGLIKLHKGTSEWSAQGLGSTCAGLVEAGVRARMKVVIIEQRQVVDNPTDYHVGEETEEMDSGEELGEPGGLRHMQGETKAEVWHERLPILCGTLKRAGAGAGYGGRTVEVGMVLRRWCRFGRGDWDRGEHE